MTYIVDSCSKLFILGNKFLRFQRAIIDLDDCFISIRNPRILQSLEHFTIPPYSETRTCARLHPCAPDNIYCCVTPRLAGSSYLAARGVQVIESQSRVSDACVAVALVNNNPYPVKIKRNTKLANFTVQIGQI